MHARRIKVAMVPTSARSGDAVAHALDDALRETFPPMEFSMAYGSGVFAQRDHDASSSLLDLVFAVDDPVAWHRANLERNASHYSFLRHLGAQGVTDFQVRQSVLVVLAPAPSACSCICTLVSSQENYGAGVYYNTLVPLSSKTLGTRMIKYGVVSSKTLCTDLYDWKTLYLSGRMHKPVRLALCVVALRLAHSADSPHSLSHSHSHSLMNGSVGALPVIKRAGPHCSVCKPHARTALRAAVSAREVL